MSKKAFDKIAAGLNEALDVVRGKAKPSKLYVPSEINVRSVLRVAGRLGVLIKGKGK